MPARGGDYSFGWSVAISGDVAIVGAPYQHAHNGAAYVFQRTAGTWQLVKQLTAPKQVKQAEFGMSVAMSGDTAVVGADGANSHTGAAFVFVRSGDTWLPQAKLVASDGERHDQFGYSVTLDGSTAVVGAMHRRSYTGAAYVFGRSGEEWSQEGELTAPSGIPGDYFGISVGIADETVIVGAFGRDTATGAAYLFQRNGSNWDLVGELTASDGSAVDDFGSDVAIDDSTVLVGAWDKDRATGAAYVFVPPW
jgi:hypothetical protein